MVTRAAVIAVICLGIFIILQALIPKAMALRNPPNMDRFITDGHTHKRKNYIAQRTRDKDLIGNIENGVAYDVKPFDPDSNPEELSAFIVDYANMIRNDVILLDKSVETRTRKRGNIKVGKYNNQVISDPPCTCKPSVKVEELGEDVFPQSIEIRNCSDGQSCNEPYVCENNAYNLTILKRRGLGPVPKGIKVHTNLKPNWYAVQLEISVGCTCNSDYVKEYNN